MKADLAIRLNTALAQLLVEHDHAFSEMELEGWAEDELVRFFSPAHRPTRLPCETVCDGRCRGAEVRGTRAFCPITRDYIHITDWREHTYRIFSWNTFLWEIQAALELPEDVVTATEDIYDLGVRIVDGRSWRVLFALSRQLSASQLRVMGLRQRFGEDGILVLSEAVLPDWPTGQFATVKVFVKDWTSVLAADLAKTTKSLTEANLHSFAVWDVLKGRATEAGVDRYTLSALMMAASSQQDRTFESATYDCVRKWFDVPVKLGGNVTGLSLPDGFLATRYGKEGHQAYSLLYDDKSFAGPDFKSKADDAHGQLYYSQLFADLPATHFTPLGVLIVSNQFPPKVQQSIQRSAPWRALMEQHPLYIVGAAALEHGHRVSEMLAPWFDSQFDRTLFAEGLFRFVYPSQLPDWAQEPLDIYGRTIETGRYTQGFVELTPLHLEFNLMLAFLLGRRRRNDVHLQAVDQVIESAPSSGRAVLSRRWSDLERRLIRWISHRQFDEARRETGLQPVTLLLLSKLQGLKSEEVPDDFWPHRARYKKWLLE